MINVQTCNRSHMCQQLATLSVGTRWSSWALALFLCFQQKATTSKSARGLLSILQARNNDAAPMVCLQQTVCSVADTSQPLLHGVALGIRTKGSFFVMDLRV
jgi:hypothetical protein